MSVGRRLAALACLLAASGAGTWAAPPPPDERAQRIHAEAIVVDGHNDVGTWILDHGFDLGMDGADPRKRNAEWLWILRGLAGSPRGDELRTHTDLARMRRGGLDAQFFSIFSDPRRFGPREAKLRSLAMLDALEAQVARHANSLCLATDAAGIRGAAKTGRIAALLGLEGGHSLENDLANLDPFHARGVRYLTLAWSNTNDWADSSGDAARHGGLTAFGRDVVRRMNDLGMLVDVSHASDETFWDAIESSRAPIIASHSSARALVDVPRNLSDPMLRAVSANGGLAMVNFGGAAIDPRKAGAWRAVLDVLLHLGPSPTPIERLLDHIDHVARTAGVDHVGLGSDFDGTLFLPDGVRDVSGFPNVTAGLLARGYSEREVRMILGENLLRVLDAVESAATAEPTREAIRQPCPRSPGRDPP